MVIRNRKLNRLKGYNYSSAGFYFVTINCKDKIPWFGKILNNDVVLNKLGTYVEKCWLEIPIHFPHITLDEYTIMPNHIHGILIIDYLENHNIVGNNNYCSLHQNKSWQTKWSKSISSAIRGFKIGVTKYCINNEIIDFSWQKSFHDRIIRNEFELNKIRNYILMNPYQLKK
ncbi:hypothetical protein KC669_03660 [Candidatus Dojkabacteria bacterium]|uniref:Transposase IS200-like domain-containing protein n=1 Tax=Candidatus Dojkabacteria bacterium TaxID=2099670 RepID=A0A955LBH6_9BACT|nr:hypothetical protein [Candidatus Dojkabacteria bacterium]